MLVDGPGDNTGVILQHPAFNKILAEEGRLPTRFQDLRVPLDAAGDLPEGLYHDPLGERNAPDRLRRRMVGNRVVPARVRAPAGRKTTRLFNVSGETGLIIVLQERDQLVTEPVRELGQRLFREGSRVLAVLVLVSIALWLVICWLREQLRRAVRRKIMCASGDSSGSKSCACHDDDGGHEETLVTEVIHI